MSFDRELDTIYLPRTSAVPAAVELGIMLTRAKENVGSVVELIWMIPGSTVNYQLRVKLAKGDGEATWVLSVDDGKQSKSVWTSQTAQLEVVRTVAQNVTDAVEAARPAPP